MNKISCEQTGGEWQTSCAPSWKVYVEEPEPLALDWRPNVHLSAWVYGAHTKQSVAYYPTYTFNAKWKIINIQLYSLLLTERYQYNHGQLTMQMVRAVCFEQHLSNELFSCMIHVECSSLHYTANSQSGHLSAGTLAIHSWASICFSVLFIYLGL